jgi:hypothetical protein
MKGMTTRTMMPPRRRVTPIMIARHELMTRHTPNHNVHMITPHGKVMSGRKGRTTQA